MSSAADRLLAAGSPIVVAGGEQRVRFTLLAIKRCEDLYGSLAGTLMEVTWLADQVQGDFPEPTAGRTAAMLQAVLGTDEPVDAETSLPGCIEAIVDGWVEAFPPVEESAPKA